jgi:hypothetical protein
LLKRAKSTLRCDRPVDIDIAGTAKKACHIKEIKIGPGHLNGNRDQGEPEKVLS